MKREILYYVIVYGFPLLGLFSMWRLCVNSRKVYVSLDNIWDRARKTNDKETLHSLYRELTEFYKKHCFCRHYGDYARQVAAYNGKLSTL